MTTLSPEQIHDEAQRQALIGIDEVIDDRMGVGEMLDDSLEEDGITLGNDDRAAAVEAIRTELKTIRDGLADEWGFTYNDKIVEA